MKEIDKIVDSIRRNGIPLTDIALRLVSQDDIISHTELCLCEGGITLQKGMNFHFSNPFSVILMSTREGAPYADAVSGDGRSLEYEGHDASGDTDKKLDQPRTDNNSHLNENGRFCQAIDEAKRDGKQCNEKVRVYEKIKTGVWAFKGIFFLRDYKYVDSGGRKVFKFILELTDGERIGGADRAVAVVHNRIIPSSVMREVYARDRGCCVKCGSTTNLCYDHILPYSKGGSSKTARNIQILCEKCNLAKTDHIESGRD